MLILIFGLAPVLLAVLGAIMFVARVSRADERANDIRERELAERRARYFRNIETDYLIGEVQRRQREQVR
jgi:hypothetical protein